MGGVIIATASITSYVPAHEGVYQYPSAKYGVCSINWPFLIKPRSWESFAAWDVQLQDSIPDWISWRLTLQVDSKLGLEELIEVTGMRAEKSKQHDYYVNQPVNGPEAIAKAIAALAADEANHGIWRPFIES